MDKDLKKATWSFFGAVFGFGGLVVLGMLIFFLFILDQIGIIKFMI